MSKIAAAIENEGGRTPTSSNLSLGTRTSSIDVSGNATWLSINNCHKQLRGVKPIGRRLEPYIEPSGFVNSVHR